MKKLKFPKRAKLITNNGFYRFIKIDGYQEKIKIPLMKRIDFFSPEIDEVDITLLIDVDFVLEKVTETMAIYREYGYVKINKQINL